MFKLVSPILRPYQSASTDIGSLHSRDANGSVRPKCETENPSGRKYCSKCGAGFSVRCPECGKENHHRLELCAALNSSNAASDSPKKATTQSPIHLVEMSAPDSLDGERKTITALFADIKGSMELMEDLDPEEARAIVDPALKLMIDAA